MERPSTTTGSGYAKRARTSAARAVRAECLQFFPDHAVGRILAAATNGNCKQYNSEQQDKFEAALCYRETFAHMHKQECNGHFNCQCGREKSREQADDKAYAADRFQEHCRSGEGAAGNDLFDRLAADGEGLLTRSGPPAPRARAHAL